MEGEAEALLTLSGSSPILLSVTNTAILFSTEQKHEATNSTALQPKYFPNKKIFYIYFLKSKSYKKTQLATVPGQWNLGRERQQHLWKYHQHQVSRISLSQLETLRHIIRLKSENI